MLAYVRSAGVAPLSRTTWDGLGLGAYVGVSGTGDNETIVAVLPIEPREVQVDGGTVRVLHQLGVHVDEPFRRQGLATLLQGQVMGIAQAVGAVAITAYAQTEAGYQWYGHNTMLPEQTIDRLVLRPTAGAAASLSEELFDPAPAPGQVQRPVPAWAAVHPRGVSGRFVTAAGDGGRAVLVVENMAAEVQAWEGDDLPKLARALAALAADEGWDGVEWPSVAGDPAHDAATDAGAEPVGKRHLMLRPVGGGDVTLDTWRHRGIDYL